jgi:hypothetical protein
VFKRLGVRLGQLPVMVNTAIGPACLLVFPDSVGVDSLAEPLEVAGAAVVVDPFLVVASAPALAPPVELVLELELEAEPELELLVLDAPPTFGAPVAAVEPAPAAPEVEAPAAGVGDVLPGEDEAGAAGLVDCAPVVDVDVPPGVALPEPVEFRAAAAPSR